MFPKKKGKSMKVSVIDIGSNTVKASIYKIYGKNRKKEIAYKGSKEMLIMHVNSNGEMSEEGVEKLFSALEKLISFSEEFDCEAIYAFATASLRKVKNSEKIKESAFHKYGIRIEILSETEEAVCSLKGLLSAPETSDVERGVMVDMGGGSTEVVLFENGKEPIIKSLKFGCLSLLGESYNDEVLLKSKHYDISKIVRRELDSIDFVERIGYPIFLIGGTARAVLKVRKYYKPTIKTLRADGSDFKFIFENSESPEFLNFLNNVIPDRKRTVISGALAYYEIVNFIKPEKILISDSGVRDGYLEKILP